MAKAESVSNRFIASLSLTVIKSTNLLTPGLLSILIKKDKVLIQLGLRIILAGICTNSVFLSVSKLCFVNM
jgi:hypothetical protein